MSVSNAPQTGPKRRDTPLAPINDEFDLDSRRSDAMGYASKWQLGSISLLEVSYAARY